MYVNYQFFWVINQISCGFIGRFLWGSGQTLLINRVRVLCLTMMSACERLNPSFYVILSQCLFVIHPTTHTHVKLFNGLGQINLFVRRRVVSRLEHTRYTIHKFLNIIRHREYENRNLAHINDPFRCRINNYFT